MNLPVPEAVQSVLATLRRAGHEAYLVGGCVRDLLLGLAPKDWDVATSAPPEAVMALFPKVAATGIRFGTVTVLTGDEAVEVTTFRREGRYRDGRRPEAVAFGVSLAEDLARRDFTVNAMAWAPEAGLVDPHGGQADLRAGRIRAVGDPLVRFAEDALRMLRAVRLAASLGFAIESGTWQALRACAPRIEAVARERVREEISRILLSDRPALGVRLLAEGGLLPHVLPELCAGAGAPGGGDWTVLDRLPPVLHLRLAALFLPLARAERQQNPHTAGAGEMPGTCHAAVEGLSCADTPTVQRVPALHRVPAERAAQVAMDALRRLRYDRASVERVGHLVRHHRVPLEPLTEWDGAAGWPTWGWPMWPTCWPWAGPPWAKKRPRRRGRRWTPWPGQPARWQPPAWRIPPGAWPSMATM